MEQKTITLKQVESSNTHSRTDKLKDLEEGDTHQGFEVINVEKQECEHPKRQWSIEKKISEDVPKLTGRCKVCGDNKEVQA